MRLLVSILVLFSATASAVTASTSLEGWRYDELRDDLRFSALVGRDVESMADRSMGHVRDIVMKRDGRLEAAVVEFEEGVGNSGVAIGIFEWSDAVIEPARNAITVSIGSDRRASQSFDVNGLSGREIVGRRVSLADVPEFGRVVDLLVDLDIETVTALLVESAEGLYALPLPVATSGDKRVGYSFTRQEVMALGEYRKSEPPVSAE